jgi:hypothetical protein
VLCAASPRGANPVNKGPSAGPSGLQDRLPWLEFGFRFELLLKTKDQLGSFRNLILGSSRGTLPAAPSCIRVSGIGVGNPLRATRIVIFRFQKIEGKGSATRGSRADEGVRPTVRCKRSMAATEMRLTDCVVAFVFSEHRAVRDMSLAEACQDKLTPAYVRAQSGIMAQNHSTH